MSDILRLDRQDPPLNRQRGRVSAFFGNSASGIFAGARRPLYCSISILSACGNDPAELVRLFAHLRTWHVIQRLR